jgi:hypothetical protein
VGSELQGSSVEGDLGAGASSERDAGGGGECGKDELAFIDSRPGEFWKGRSGSRI